MQPTSGLNNSRDWPRSFASIHEGRSATANERLKARSPLLLNRSLILAALLHGALLLFSPEWVRSAAEPGDPGTGLGTQVVTFGSDLEGSDGGWEAEGGEGHPDGGSAPILLAVDGAALVDGSGEQEADSGRNDDADEVRSRTAGGSAAGLDRLATLRPALSLPAEGSGDLVPTGSEPDLSEPGHPGESRDGGAEGGTANGLDGHTRSLRSELAEQLEDRLTREEILDLERLSALRPELALTSPSTWILIRNPMEVGEFLERRFGATESAERPRGAMSVAIWIDERGSVEWAEINRSSGDADLDRSALELFERVVSFRPAREDGFRVPTAVIFWLSFW